jgi:hypothetical protein
MIRPRVGTPKDTMDILEIKKNAPRSFRNCWKNLRADNYIAKKVATRIAKYFRNKLELFGEASLWRQSISNTSVGKIRYVECRKFESYILRKAARVDAHLFGNANTTDDPPFL